MVRVGAVTIGQSPRDAVVPEIASRIGQGVEIIQRGALDGIAADVIRTHSPSSAETTLVSRLADGTEVTVDKSFIVPRLQEQIFRLEQEGVSLILLLCTHKFEELQSSVALLLPSVALERIVERSKVRRLGVFTPSRDQIPAQSDRWKGLASEKVRVASASPYVAGSNVEDAAIELRNEGVDFAAMDCIGYTESMRSIAQQVLNVPVHSAVSALGDVAFDAIRAESGTNQ